MHAAHFSSVLPDKFRHKTSKVRVPLPKAILIDFHGTISERRWEDKVIYPYVRQAVDGYLQSNWHNETVQKCLPGLRNESFEQRFRNKFDDAPVIDEPVSSDDDRLDSKHLAQQVGEFLVWQLTSKRVTTETRMIESLVWRDGMSQKKISTPIYDDVLTCIREWRHKYNISIYVISSLDLDTLKLLFKNTSKGNLDQYLTDYISAKDGDKRVVDVYSKLHDRIKPQQPKFKRASSPPSARDNLNVLSNQGSDKSLSLRSPKSPQLTAGSSFDGITRPIVYLTDSGQEAKAASQVADGGAFECLLVNRPGNKRFRTYYLGCFPYIDTFDDIEFVR